MVGRSRAQPPGACLCHACRRPPLRPLTPDERRRLERIGRSRAEPAGYVARAQELLAVADGRRVADAARLAGRRGGDAVARLVARFNREGLAALEPGHGGGQPRRYTPTERERILREVRRAPDRDRDGAAAWSLVALQRALRRASDGLPGVSTHTIWCALRDAGFTWDRDRSWCATGTAVRKRTSGTVTVTDPDATAKKT